MRKKKASCNMRAGFVGGHNSVGRVPASQAGCHGFESRCPLHFPHPPKAVHFFFGQE